MGKLQQAREDRLVALGIRSAVNRLKAKMSGVENRIDQGSEWASSERKQGAEVCSSITREEETGEVTHSGTSAELITTHRESLGFDETLSANSTADLNNFFAFATVEETSPQWESSDLQAILSHQLSTPMAFDFCATIKSWVETEESRTWPANKMGTPKSFNDLFTHLSPSLRLLNLTKQFAKANWEHPESLLPKEIAVVLYYTSIAVAYVRKGEWITKLSTVDAKSGFEWIQSQSWVDKGTKNICLEAVESLN